MLRLFLAMAVFVVVSCCAAPGVSYEKEFPHHKRTKFFDIRSKNNPGYVEEIGRFADAFIGLLNRDFFKATFDYPIRVLLLEDKARFQQFLRSSLAVRNPPNFGIYFPDRKMFVTYPDSGLGTFAHEILHPLVMDNFKNLPIWAIEGIPTFFEKFYGYWDNENLVVRWGYHNPWRIDMLGPDLVRLDLKKLLATKNSQGEFNESDIRMVSMFLWSQGKFQRFLELQRANEKKGFKSCFEAALEKPLDEILPLWTKYLEDVAAARPKIMRLPASVILQNESAFLAFSNRIGAPLNPGTR